MYIKHRIRKLANVVLDRFNIPKIPPRIPFYFIEVTNTCNLNCDFCPRYDLSRGTGFMEFDIFKLVIKRIKEMGARYVSVNRFGESLVHPQFMEMLRYAKNQGIPNVGYVSNGQLLEFRPIANYGSSQRLKNLPHIKTTKSKILTCIQPWQRLNMFYNGDVNPCCGDVDGELVLGNIKDFSIKELWHGEKIKRIRKILTTKVLDELPVCLSCDGSDRDWHDQSFKATSRGLS